MWPDFLSKERLACRLDLTVGAVEQYVKRGLLPAPVKIGDALRWDWAEVCSKIRATEIQPTGHANTDPYDVGARGAGKASSTCGPRPQ